MCISNVAIIMMLLEATAVVKHPLTFRTGTPVSNGSLIGGA
jgi:hypothetical protein